MRSDSSSVACGGEGEEKAGEKGVRGTGKGVSLASSRSVREANNQCSGVDGLTLFASMCKIPRVMWKRLSERRERAAGERALEMPSTSSVLGRCFCSKGSLKRHLP